MNDETISTTNVSPGTLALEALIRDAALGPEDTEQEKKKKSLKLMEIVLKFQPLGQLVMFLCLRSTCMSKILRYTGIQFGLPNNRSSVTMK